MRKVIFIVFFLPLCVFAQEITPALEKQARKFVRDGNELYNQQKFSDAEVAYKKAIEKNPNYEIANYNLGNALLQQKRNKEAVAQFELVAKITKNKLTRAEAMHNIGNSFYEEKNYQKSIEAYKHSLRNNPKDEETRYNLALAQEKLEDQEQDKNDDNQDKDKENKDDQNKDKKEGEDEKDDEKKDGDDEDDKKDQEDNKDEKKDQEGQPQPEKLTPQQVQQLLEAMNNEEKKTQEKMNAKKERGKKIKQEKDW